MGARRRVALLALAASLAGCGDARRPPERRPLARFGPDELRYDLKLAHAGHVLSGEERIAFRNPFRAPLDHVWLRVWDNAFGSCAHPRLRVEVRAGAGLGARRRGCTALRLDLDRPIGAGRRASVRLGVRIEPPPRFDRFGRLGDIDVLGNALPVLAVSDGGAEPALPRYTFAGESFFSLTAAWRVRLGLQPGERVAATGTEAPGRGDTVVLSAPAERDFALVIGRMDRRQATAGGVRVRWFDPPETPARRAAAGLRQATSAVVALQRDLGAYGARELDVLDAPPHVAATGIAMEYPQLILSPPFPQAVSHEIAHQWFYRLVGDDEWSDPWVDETLTEFAAVRLGRAVHGPDRLRGCVQHERPARPPAPVDADMGTLERLDRRRRAHVIRDTLYVEGPCALLNLQRRTGRARMTAFLGGLVREHRGGVLTGAQLRRAIAGLPGGGDAVTELRVGERPAPRRP